MEHLPGTHQSCTEAVTIKGGRSFTAHASYVTGDSALLYLDVAIVWPFVAIHTLHRGRLPLHQMDSKQWFEPHGVANMGVMRWQVHPADDEQSVHLQQGDSGHTGQGSLLQSTTAHHIRAGGCRHEPTASLSI